MAEITTNTQGVTTTPAAGTTTDVNITKVNGTALSATNPVNTQPSQGGTATTAANPSPVQLSQANAALSTSNVIPVAVLGIGDSLSKGGTAAAPGSGSAIVSLTVNQPAGLYKVNLVWSISGAIETAGLNVRLSDASSSFTAIDLPSNNGSVAGQSWTFTIDRLNVTSSTNTIKIVAAAAAAASTVYSVGLTITRIA